MPPEPPKTRDPIRVLLYSPKGAGLHYGGPGMTAYRMYSAAPARCFAITLVHAFPPQAPYELFREQVRLTTARRGPLGTWSLARRSDAWVRDHAASFDVFHGLQAFHVTVRAAVAAERAGVPAVIKPAAHRSDFTDKGGLKDLLGLPRKRRRWIRDLSGIIAISSAIADEVAEYGVPRERIARIPNGVDIHGFRPATDEAERQTLRAALGWDERPTVLFSGVMTARKRPLLVIEAVDRLIAAGKGCRVVFAGPFPEPEYERRMRELVASRKLESSVSFLGFVEDVAAMYRAADVFVLPSMSEGMPNALLEAMASGLPGVATAISGVTDLIDDGVNGALVEPAPGPLAEALGTYLEDPATRVEHGAAARRLVERQYAAEAVARAHEHLFRTIMSGGAAAEASLVR